MPDALPCRCAIAPALARWLSARNFEAEHVGECGLAAASDSAIWDYALRNEAIIVTKDDDFAQRKGLVDRGPTVLWIRFPNARTRDLVAWFEIVFPAALQALSRGEALVELI